MADSELIASPVPVLHPDLVGDLAGVRDLVDRSKAARTRQEYQRDWRSFAAWAATRSVVPEAAEPEHVAAYVAHLVAAGRRESTITRAVYAITAHFDELGRSGPDNPGRHPGVKATTKGMRRTVGIDRRKARPLTTTELGRMSAALDQHLLSIRDRALLLIGFAAALRRSELAALETADITDTPAGLEIRIRRSKTDQEGAGHVIPVAPAADPVCCPVTAWRAWRHTAALTQGRAFRAIDRHGNVGEQLSARAVSMILERAATAAGINPDRLSAHSLRAGYVTTAAQRGHNERAIGNVSRHKSITVLRSYVRSATIWQDAATDLGW